MRVAHSFCWGMNMNKSEIITAAQSAGIVVKEISCGIFNPWQAYAFEPSDSEHFKYHPNMYHVACNTSRNELLSGVRLMAERMGVQKPA